MNNMIEKYGNFEFDASPTASSDLAEVMWHDQPSACEIQCKQHWSEFTGVCQVGGQGDQ